MELTYIYIRYGLLQTTNCFHGKGFTWKKSLSMLITLGSSLSTLSPPISHRELLILAPSLCPSLSLSLSLSLSFSPSLYFPLSITLSLLFSLSPPLSLSLYLSLSLSLSLYSTCQGRSLCSRLCYPGNIDEGRRLFSVQPSAISRLITEDWCVFFLDFYFARMKY